MFKKILFFGTLQSQERQLLLTKNKLLCVLNCNAHDTTKSKNEKTQYDTKKDSNLAIMKSNKEHIDLKRKPFEQPKDAKFCRVAIIGTSNVGKSTLVNALTGVQISCASIKAQTTRKNVIGIITQDNKQIELVDTPGVVTPAEMMKYKLEGSFLRDPAVSGSQCDIIVVIVDASQPKKREIDRFILNLLYKNRDKESVLVFNKVDLVSRKRILLNMSTDLTLGGKLKGVLPSFSNQRIRFNSNNIDEMLKRGHVKDHHNVLWDSEEKILPPTDNQKGWGHFSRVFMISALTGDGVDDLKDFMLNKAKSAEWIHSPYLTTNRTPMQLVLEAIRGRMLDNINNDIPYSLEYKFEEWEVEENGEMNIHMIVICPTKRHLAKVIGTKGSIIQKILQESIYNLSKLFKCKVNLKTSVRLSSE